MVDSSDCAVCVLTSQCWRDSAGGRTGALLSDPGPGGGGGGGGQPGQFQHLHPSLHPLLGAAVPAAAGARRRHSGQLLRHHAVGAGAARPDVAGRADGATAI